MKNDAPMRDETRANFFEAKYGSKDWYDWRLKHWGTKGMGGDVAIEPLECIDKVKKIWTKGYHFDTAWSPMIPLMVEMSRQFPDLEFSLGYREESNEFEGDAEAKAGELISDVCGKCENTDDEDEEEEDA